MQCSANSNIKKYSLISSIAPFFKVFAIISLLGLFWSLYFFIAFGTLWLTSMALNYYKNKLLFIYKYSINDNKLVVYKEDLLFKKQILASIELSEITKCSINENLTDNIPKYYDKNFDNGFVVKIATNNKNFAIISDEYMYSVLNLYLKEKEDIK